MIVNTTRLAFFGRRREVGIMRLVGASSTYIQLPFMLEGVVAGLAGAIVAFLALLFARSYMFSPFARLLNAGLTSQDVVGQAALAADLRRGAPAGRGLADSPALHEGLTRPR